MELLLSVLKEIRDGRYSFGPKDSTQESMRAFQPVAARLQAMLDQYLVQDVKFLRSSSQVGRPIVSAVVIGGLTFEGEQFLRREAAPRLDPAIAFPTEYSTISATSTRMKIFISHSSVDSAVAEEFVELLRAAFVISAEEIRCTSVAGFKLEAGVDSNEQLRQEVFESAAFIALLSAASLQSNYVLFELGARWGAKRYLAPVLISGATPALLKAPLNAIHAISAGSQTDMHQLIDSISKNIGLPAEKPHAFAKALTKFIAAAA
jgi:TIR domain